MQQASRLLPRLRAAVAVAPRLASAPGARAQSGYAAGGGGAGARGVPKARPFFMGNLISREEACFSMRLVHARVKDLGNNTFSPARHGAVVIEVTPRADRAEGSSERPSYDWARKQSFSLSAQHIIELNMAPKNGVLAFTRSAYYNGETTITEFRVGPAGDGAGVRVEISKAKRVGGERGGAGAGPAEPAGSAAITLAPHELQLLKTLSWNSLNAVTGWTLQLDPASFDPAAHLLPAGGPGGAGSDAELS